ncbi:SDR family oxidoreductase [Chondromyces crocatus]|uniref:3-beta hydroxysteroid dehydrogenase n=1 Tax=Chondromyces crocatus TaxID=52 RepID=A0A0K1EKJ4_CHOCO|nr:SDR family oxidoreductase [Chondromyces crocatus]AKT41098.1 3-beta hydroxysteroid dehydrogenase [Chondromyces crocatus]
MRVFITGATGFVGAAVVRELIDAGHHVLGLARSDASAAALDRAGAEVHRGSIHDLDSLRSGASACDGVIHTAFDHDFSKYREHCEADRRVIEALGAALSGSDHPLIVTSAVGVLPLGQRATEATPPVQGAQAHPRAATEEAAAAVAARGVRVSVVRLPPSVHGEGDHGFVPILIDIARRTGASACVDDGQNRWPAVHRRDAARLYRLVLEAPDVVPTAHAIAEEGIPFRDIATAIGRHTHLPVVSTSAAEAARHFGWFAGFAALDIPTSSARTQERLGWRPEQIGLLADLEQGHYFTTRPEPTP